MRHQIRTASAMLVLALFFTFFVGTFTQTPLRVAAEGKGFFIGAAANYNHLTQGDQKYRQMLGQQYNLITPEFSCKWAFTEPNQNAFTFSECDTVVQFAQENNQHFRGHNLVWGEYNPSWIYSLRCDSIYIILYSLITLISFR